MHISQTTNRSRRSLADRFWSHVDIRGSDECWPWKLATSEAGYGNINVQVEKRKRRFAASRIAFLLTHGEVPDDRLVCHSCDNPPCCNPAHLFLGTYGDNNRDTVSKGRAVKNPPRGEQTKGALFTNEQAKTIRARYEAGESRAALAREYGADWNAIDRAARGVTYRDKP